MMIEYGRQSVDGRDRWSLPLMRVQPGQRSLVTIQSHQVIWLATHWVGKQVLCPGEDCELCQALSSRTHGYLVCAISDLGRERFVMLELTSGCWQRPLGILDCERRTTLSGTVVEVSRRRKRSPLHIDPCFEYGKVHAAASTVTRQLNAIAVLFGVSIAAESESAEEWAKRVAPAVRSIALAAYAHVV